MVGLVGNCLELGRLVRVCRVVRLFGRWFWLLGFCRIWNFMFLLVKCLISLLRCCWLLML